MSKPLKLTLTKVACQDDQMGEPRKDEIYLVLFGITGGGHRLYVPPTGLGSYGKGAVSKSTFPKSLINVSVADDELVASLCIWLFERDRGGLDGSGADLEAAFDARVTNLLAFDAALSLPSVAKHLYAFAQSMLGMRFELETFADSWFNSDELLLPRFHHLFATLPQPGVDTGFEAIIEGAGAKYLLNFSLDFRWEPGPAVIG